MLDVSVSYNRYKFLGHEFLTWLWFAMENEQNKLKNQDGNPVTLNIGNRVVLENHYNNAVESITIKGDDAGLEEGFLALKKGAVVTELHLAYKTGDQEWRFNIKGESLNIGNLKSPETGVIESKKDIEGALLEKVYLYEKVVSLIDHLYIRFIKIRVSADWARKIVPRMKKWISA